MSEPHRQESDTDEFRITRWQLSQVAKYADLERIVWAILNKPCASHSSAREQQRIDAVLQLIKKTNDECCGGYGLWEMNSDECMSFGGNCTLCKVSKAIALLQEERK